MKEQANSYSKGDNMKKDYTHNLHTYIGINLAEAKWNIMCRLVNNYKVIK